MGCPRQSSSWTETEYSLCRKERIREGRAVVEFKSQSPARSLIERNDNSLVFYRGMAIVKGRSKHGSAPHSNGGPSSESLVVSPLCQLNGISP